MIRGFERNDCIFYDGRYCGRCKKFNECFSESSKIMKNMFGIDPLNDLNSAFYIPACKEFEAVE